MEKRGTRANTNTEKGSTASHRGKKVTAINSLKDNGKDQENYERCVSTSDSRFAF